MAQLEMLLVLCIGSDGGDGDDGDAFHERKPPFYTHHHACQSIIIFDVNTNFLLSE